MPAARWASLALALLLLSVGLISTAAAEPRDVRPTILPGPLMVNASAATAYPNCYTGEVDVSFWANVTGGQPRYDAVWSFPDGAHASGFAVTHHFRGWVYGRYATVNVTDNAGHSVEGVAELRFLLPPCAPPPNPQPAPAFATVVGVTAAGILVLVLASVVVARRQRGRPPTPPTP